MPGLDASSSLEEPSSKAALAVLSKYQDFATKHNELRDQVRELKEEALATLPDAVAEELGLGEEARQRCVKYLNDDGNLFRFFRRSRYSQATALSLLSGTLIWRLKTDLDSLSLSSLHPLYVSPPEERPPLFWGSGRFKDRYGRPCGVISLRSLERANKTDLDECKEFIVGCMESTRRCLAESYRQWDAAGTSDDLAQAPPLQMVIAFSLQASGMANLELELLPFLLDLLKNHFPSMAGAVYVLHYGWVHAGMWGIAKRVLPQQALARIFFPSNEELVREHFDARNLPACFGGEWDVELTESTNEMMRRYARPEPAQRLSVGGGGGSVPSSPKAAESPMLRPGKTPISRTGSFESALDEFFSTNPTPGGSRRPSQPATPRGESSSLSYFPSTSQSGHSLQMTPRAERKLQHLQMTRGAGSRSRAGSDANAGARDNVLGLTINVSGFSPAGTPGASATNSPTSKRQRTRSAAAPVPSSSQLASRRRGRSVHFHASPTVSPAMSRRTSPISRVGSLRDFRLATEDMTPGTGVDVGAAADGSDSEDSNRSGKAGETGAGQGAQDEAAATGFFSRWRRRPSQGSMASPDPGLKEEASKQQQEKHKEPLDLQGEELDLVEPASPHLQVPHMEEPPLSGASFSQSGLPAFLSRRTRKYNKLPGAVSPYNASNPFWGYPAVAVQDNAAAASRGFDLAGATPRHLHVRRRKRDLMRTLSYLFVLRLLSLHRSVRALALALWRAFARLVFSSDSQGLAAGDVRWREAEERYQKLRRASNWQGAEQAAKVARQRLEEERKRLRGQPLAQLGIRKRYILAVLVLALLRRSWRVSALDAVRSVSDSAKLVAVLAAGKVAGQDGAPGGENATMPLDGAPAEALPPSFSVGSTTSSITGLHLRSRLGLRS